MKSVARLYGLAATRKPTFEIIKSRQLNRLLRSSRGVTALFVSPLRGGATINPAARLFMALEEHYPKTAVQIAGVEQNLQANFKTRHDFSFKSPDSKFCGSTYGPVRKVYDELSKFDVQKDEALSELRPSIASLIAKRIRLFKDPNNLNHTFTVRDLHYMQQRGYTAENIKFWAQILSCSDVSEAIEQLYSQTTQKLAGLTTSHAKSFVCPLLIPLFLLKRISIPTKCLQKLLLVTWAILRQPSDRVAFHDRQIFLLFVRFHRHALQVWVPGISQVTTLITTFLPCRYNPHLPLTEVVSTRLTSMFNRALKLLSHKAPFRPYLSYWFIEQAQFLVLSKMSKLHPPLDLTPLGYKGLVTSQLTSKHTPQEREWINLQSRASPPYLQPQNGFDEGKTLDVAASRAMKTIKHMHASGYIDPEWSNVAKIYAGWEVDGTPTIQSRYIMPNSGYIQEHPGQAMWAARIHVTRDIREAWHAFLRCKASGLAPDSYVYHALFKKLISERNRLAHSNQAAAVVGDVQVLMPPAASPLQKVYLESEPPNYMELFKELMRAEVPLPQFISAHLVANAPSLSDGLNILVQLYGPDITTSFLLSAVLDSSFAPMGPAMFRGVVELLASFPLDRGFYNTLSESDKSDFKTSYKNVFGSQYRTSFVTKFHATAIFQAYCLLIWRKSTDVNCWSTLIKGVIKACPSDSSNPCSYNYIEFVMQIMKSMETQKVLLQGEMLSQLSHFLETAVREARSMLLNSSSASTTPLSVELAKLSMRHGKQLLRKFFIDLTSVINVDDGVKFALKLLKVPSFTTMSALLNSMDLLRYSRAVATLGDPQDMLDLAKWIVVNEEWIAPIIGIQDSGARRWRQITVVVRLFCESPDAFHIRVPTRHATRTPESIAKEIRRELAKLKTLSPWPKFGEVQEYLKYISKEWSHTEIKPDAELEEEHAQEKDREGETQGQD